MPTQAPEARAARVDLEDVHSFVEERLGFEAAVQRDYPIVFGTLYVFALVGLVVGIISDITYTLVDPRIDFEKRAG